MTRRFVMEHARLVALVLTVAAPLALSAFFWIDQRRQAAAEAEKEVLDLARLVAVEQRQLTAMARDVLAGVARSPAVRRATVSDDCQRALARLLRQNSQYANLGVITPTGDLVCSAAPLIQPVNLADRACFRGALAARDLAVGDYGLNPNTGMSSLTFGYPVLDARGTVTGVACAVLNAPGVGRLLEDARFARGATLVVFNDRGEVMARYPGAPAQPMADQALMHAVLAQRDEGTARVTDADGLARLYGIVPLYRSADESVYIGVGLPIETAAIGAQQLALAWALVLASFAAFWLVIEHSVKRRVRPLLDALHRLEGLPDGGHQMWPGAVEAGSSVPAQEDLKRVNRALAARCALHSALERVSDEQALLRVAARVLVEAGPYAHVAVVCASARTGRHVAAQWGFGEDLLPREVTGQSGPIATALATGRYLIVDDVASLVAPLPAPRALRRAAVLPQYTGDDALGALVVFAVQADAFGIIEADLLADVAHDLAQRAGVLRRAQRDPVTGLPNAERLEARLQSAIAQPAAPLAVLFLDLDRFRDINDAFGFAHGDRVLKAVGERTRAAMPPDAFVGRMHGDEFAVLLPHAGYDEAQAAATHLIAALEPAFALEGVAIDMHASIGIALYPAHGRTVGELLRRADIAARHAKRMESGHALYAHEHDQPTQLALAGELHRAIKNDELILHFQPKIDAKSGSVIGAEVLVRWQRPEYGLVMPADFIPLAERSGLIRPLTQWVLEACVSQCADWHRRGIGLPLAVNFSARTLLDPRLVQHIEALFRGHRMSPGQLQLELTESVLMERRHSGLDVLTQLRALGVSLYIDDFGMGYSSFDYLKRLPVDAIKIDKSFVGEMLTDAKSAFIVRAMIELAHGLDIETVAEGVETQAAWDRLRAIGCDAIQGFYVSEPLPAAQFEAWLGRAPAAP